MFCDEVTRHILVVSHLAPHGDRKTTTYTSQGQNTDATIMLQKTDILNGSVDFDSVLQIFGTCVT